MKTAKALLSVLSVALALTACRKPPEKQTEAQQDADQRPDQAAGDRRRRQGHEYLQEALDEDGAVHPQDAADDDAGDEQIEEIGVLGELDD